jgi:hypothetical protein
MFFGFKTLIIIFNILGILLLRGMETVQLKIDGYVINISTQNMHLQNVAAFVTENNLLCRRGCCSSSEGKRRVWWSAGFNLNGP